MKLLFVCMLGSLSGCLLVGCKGATDEAQRVTPLETASGGDVRGGVHEKKLRAAASRR